ncbi:MAG: peptide MFS transporter, partial [Clostridiales bacterium]|nr:peptide MFS transporter [Clostridiales bacterium]
MQKVIKKQQHPKGLYLLFGVEAWERFSYYGMRALLVLFMTSTVIGFNDSQSAKLYGWFTGLVFLTPLIGGYLADRLIGKRRSIVIGGLLMAIGQFTLAAYDLIPPRISLFAGLTLIAVGNGFFKPNISAMVGDLYEPDDFKRRNEAFSIFYVGINLGAMIAPLICGYLGEAVAWKYGFLSAGCGMLLALLAYFLLQKKYLGKIGLYPAEKENKTTSEHKEKKPLTK